MTPAAAYASGVVGVIRRDFAMFASYRTALFSQLLTIVRRYPTLVDGAFIIIALVGAKLLVEYAAAMGWIHFEVPKWLSLGLIAVIFTIAFVYARRVERRTRPTSTEGAAHALLTEPIAPAL